MYHICKGVPNVYDDGNILSILRAHEPMINAKTQYSWLNQFATIF
jgi:hypothetical protein